MSAQTFEAAVRYQGANFAEHIAKIYLNGTLEFGEGVMRRLVWEIIRAVIENHGPTVAIDMLREAQASIHLDMAPPIAVPEPEGPDPVVQALEGLTTLTNQNREAVFALASAVGRLAETFAKAGQQ